MVLLLALSDFEFWIPESNRANGQPTTKTTKEDASGWHVYFTRSYLNSLY